MRARAYVRSCSGSRDGIALVIVLAFILLLTILTVSFISFTQLNRSSTASYGSSIQAQEVALGGVEDILSDLHEEIVAGSTTNLQSGTTLYFPCTNLTAVPARIGYTQANYGTDTSATLLAPSLIRVSRATSNPGDSFFTQFLSSPYTNSMALLPGGLPILNRASLASTAAPSVNGRAISAARWNKTYLLAPTVATIPAPFLNAPPDWVYVTRTGSRVCSTTTPNELQTTPGLKYSSSVTTDYYNGAPATPGVNPPVSPVVGRYAFVMYDESALLDASVAGYTSASAYIDSTADTNLVSTPANPNTGMTQAVNGKSYLAYADLTQLPGFSGSGGQTAVDNFVNWRNGSAGGTGNGYLLALIGYAQNGFLKFNSGSPGGPGDSPLVGRQDLINYFANIDANINSASATFSNALPYLGTFSRAVNAPTWSPPADAQNMAGYIAGTGTPVSYKSNAETSGSINRDLSNLRWPSPVRIQHYKDDGTLAQYADSTGTLQSYYSVKAGDPMLQNRFSLARIGWLTHTGPATGKTAAVQACFGLTWGADALGNPLWVYKDGNASQILTLDQVAALGREPDFFELLKAAILSGSLGKTPGKEATDLNFTQTNQDPNFGNKMGVAGSSFDTIMNDPDLQILQIGANIIDQYDTDSYPTAIHLEISGGDPSVADGFVQGPGNTVYGQENLPQLTRISSLAYEQTPNYLSGWYQPELWNPYQVPSNPNLLNWPTKFRITMYGSAAVWWNEFNISINNIGTIPAVSSKADTYNGTQSQSHIYFELNTPFDLSSGPQLLTTKVVKDSTGTDPANIWQPSTYQSTDNGNPFLAIAIGQDTSNSPNYLHYSAPSTNPDGVYDDPAATINEWISPASPGVTFVLEYYDGSQYLPYSFTSRLEVYNGDTATPNKKGDSTDPIHFVTNIFSPPGLNTPVEDKFYAHSDPRTDRFSCAMSEAGYAGIGPNGYNSKWSYDLTLVPGVAGSGLPIKASPELCYPQPDASASPTVPSNGAASPSNGFFYDPRCISYGWALDGVDAPDVGDWVENNPQNNHQYNPSGNDTCWAYYSDPDGVVRPGDSYRVTYSTISDGNMNYVTPVPAGAATNNTQNGRRPIMLNRPFRSVGELGYAFRDLPYKSLDFLSTLSADAALLDVFAIDDEPAVVAGQVNPSSAPTPVLKAILAGGAKKEIDPTLAITTTTAGVVAQAISTQVQNSAKGPLLNRANLVTTLSDAINAALANANDQGDKPYAEAPVRALADVTNTRTWNLLIDIIAQSGQMSPTAQSLNDFVVQGERRYWLHIAIDRYTGKIVDQQLEPVYE